MKKIMLIISLLALSLFAGCGTPEFTNEAILNCEEGIYAPTDYQLEMAEEQGWELDYNKVYIASGNSNQCVQLIKLKKPIIIFGTEKFSFDIKYTIDCMDTLMKQNKSAGDVIDYCRVS